MGTLYLMNSLVSWHYTRAIADMFFIWRNFMTTVYRIFDVTGLFKTLISPWRRLTEPYKNGQSFELYQFVSAIVVNTIMRIVGFFVRIVFILFALIFFIVLTFSGIVVFLFWVFMPVVILGSLALGITLLVT